MVLWDDITDSEPTTLVGDALAFDTFAMFVTHRDLRRAAARGARHRRLPAAGGPRRARGLRPVPRRGHGWDRDGSRQRPDRAVRRPGDAVARVVRTRRQPPPPRREHGERHQVLHPRQLLVGVPAVRDRARLRRHRLDQHLHHRRLVPGHDAARTQRCTGARRRRTPAGRTGVQGGRRPVPRVDAGRVPGRTHAGHVVHGIGRQGRRVRRPAACLRRRAALLPRRLAAGRVGAGAGLDAGRLDPRRRADRRQADARLLLDQPRRLHARRAGSRGTRRRRGRQWSRRTERDGVPHAPTR